MLVTTRLRPTLAPVAPVAAQQPGSVELPGPVQPPAGPQQATPKCCWVSVRTADGRSSLACRWMDADEAG